MMSGRVTVIAKRRIWKILAVLAVLFLISSFITAGGVRKWYLAGLEPAGTATEKVVVTIPVGSSLSEITQILNKSELLKNPKAFEWYVRTHELRDELKAGTYRFSKSMSATQIADMIVKADVAKDLFTILPTQRLDQIKASFVKAGFSEADITSGLDIKTHARHPVFAEDTLPPTLEGYLYPESFQRDSATNVAQIVNASLNEMQKRLTPARKAAYQKQGLTVRQAVILASIVENEVNTPQDRKQVAQVFLLRLKQNMQLGSDVTYIYAAATSGKVASPDLDSPYNTRKYAGLPPGPISNVSESSLEALASPAAGDFLYFVTGDDGTTHFSHTVSEHEQLTSQYCKKLCRLNQ